MAATLGATTVRGTPVHTGERHAVITASETNQLKTVAGKLSHVVVWGAGSGWTIAIYDDPNSNDHQIWGWATADGVGTFALQIPCQYGLRVVTASGTPGSITVVYQ